MLSFRTDAATAMTSRTTFYVCQAYAPRAVSPLLERLMQWTRTGMQLELWLRKR